MPQRPSATARPTTALLTATAIGLAVLLGGCTATTPPPAAPPASAPATAPAATEAPVPATPNATPTTPPAAAGCKANSATMPSGAVSKKVPDLDGDGRADTEWISATPSLRFGVTTASGATISYSLPTASPAPREGFVTHLNDHRIVSIADDNRSAYVHFLVKCAWVTPKNSSGAQYTFDLQNLTGHGTGVGCSMGYVVGFQTTQTASGYTVKKTQLLLNVTGSYASSGPTTTVVTNAPASDPRVKTAKTISCATVTIAGGGVKIGG